MRTIDENCIFCKIANGKIPTHMVYEDDDVAAFLDAGQVTFGHTLLVPKYHLKDIFAYDDQDVQTVFARLPKIAKAVKDAFPDVKGVNILNNNGELAGQSVFHSHLHIIPRYSDTDDFDLKWQPQPEGTYSAEALDDLAKTINAQIKES